MSDETLNEQIEVVTVEEAEPIQEISSSFRAMEQQYLFEDHQKYNKYLASRDNAQQTIIQALKRLKVNSTLSKTLSEAFLKAHDEDEDYEALAQVTTMLTKHARECAAAARSFADAVQARSLAVDWLEQYQQGQDAKKEREKAEAYNAEAATLAEEAQPEIAEDATPEELEIIADKLLEDGELVESAQHVPV